MIRDRQALREDLIRDEDLRLEAYRDSLGNFTIGVGHLMDGAATGLEKITRARAMELLEEDIDAAEALVGHVFGNLDDVEDVRVRALVNMAFNLGPRLRKFVAFVAAVERRDWPAAAREMMESADHVHASQWAIQVGERAVRLRDLIRDG